MRPDSGSSRQIPLPVCLLVTFTLFASAFGRGVSGIQTCRYQAVEDIAAYQNAGYQLFRDASGELIVSISATPVRCGVAYPWKQPDPEMDHDLDTDFREPPHQLPPALKRQLEATHGYWEAVSIVLFWISDQFIYSERGLGPYSGDCDTAARTTVQLLRLAGIPAREAVGVIMDTEQKTLAGTSLHRFVEIYYPDMGWLFSDPLSSHHFVPASYIRLDATRLDSLLGLRIERKKPLPPLQPVGILDENPVPGRINLLRFF